MSAAIDRPEPLVLVGAGGHGRETAAAVDAINAVQERFAFVGFVADEADDVLLDRLGATLLGPTSRLADVLAAHDAVAHVAIGDGARRIQLGEAVRATGRRWVSLIDPRAVVGSDVRVGEGVYVAPAACVTTNVSLGDGAQLNVGVIVSHDCEIGDGATLSPGVRCNGNVTVEPLAFLGTGAIVIPGVRIGRAAVVGAGAVVVRDVAPGETVLGVPARPT